MIINRTYGGHILRIAFGISALIMLMASGAGAATITVNASGSAMYMRIQDAINNASNGDTILVYNGTYYENVIVGKSLTLRGENKTTTIINGSGNGDVITIQANDTSIYNFTITGSGHNWYDSGIGIGNFYKNNNITNNILTGNERGFKCWYCSVNITRNFFKDNANDAIYIVNNYPSVIEGWPSTIEENEILL